MWIEGFFIVSEANLPMKWRVLDATRAVRDQLVDLICERLDRVED